MHPSKVNFFQLRTTALFLALNAFLSQDVFSKFLIKLKKEEYFLNPWNNSTLSLFQTLKINTFGHTGLKAVSLKCSEVKGMTLIYMM